MIFIYFIPGCSKTNTLITSYNLAIDKVDVVIEKLEEILVSHLKGEPQHIWDFIENTKEEFSQIK